MTATRSERRRQRESRRLPAIAIVAALVAGVVVLGDRVDRRADAEPEAVAVDAAAALAPVAPGAGSLGSTWYCAGGTGLEGGSADHRVVVVNPGERPVDVVVTAFAGGIVGHPAATDAEPVVQELEVAARGRTTLRLGDVLPAQFVAALVEVAEGEVAVEHVVRGEDDVDAAACATTPSAQWHLAAGATTVDARERLVLFNPFPDDAVVDITFTTPESYRAPPEYAGFVVPAQRVVAIDVGQIASRHAQVAMSVVARSGRLVVDRVQTFDGSNGPEGLAVTTAAPSPAEVWYLPDGFRTEGLQETVTVYNPGDAQAEVDVELVVDPSDDPAIVTAVEPFQLSIPPRRYAQVALHAEDRVPPELGHSVVVRSQNGVPVVAERWIRSADPAPREGLAATMGSPIVSTRWLTAAGGTGEAESEFLVVVNPSPDAIVRFSVATPTESQLLPVEGLQDVEVRPGQRRRIDLGEFVNRDFLPLVVTASRPLAVERGWYPAVGGLSQSIAIAAGDAEVPAVIAAR